MILEIHVTQNLMLKFGQIEGSEIYSLYSIKSEISIFITLRQTIHNDLKNLDFIKSLTLK